MRRCDHDWLIQKLGALSGLVLLMSWQIHTNGRLRDELSLHWDTVKADGCRIHVTQSTHTSNTLWRKKKWNLWYVIKSNVLWRISRVIDTHCPVPRRCSTARHRHPAFARSVFASPRERSLRSRSHQSCTLWQNGPIQLYCYLLYLSRGHTSDGIIAYGIIGGARIAQRS
jgi:hypothetical protein